MLFQIRKELGFTRVEWFALNRHDRRMYSEQLAEHLYQEQHQNWVAGGKKGPPPVSPEELIARAERELEKSEDENASSNVKPTRIDEPEDYPDIEDLPGVKFS